MYEFSRFQTQTHTTVSSSSHSDSQKLMFAVSKRLPHPQTRASVGVWSAWVYDAWHALNTYRDASSQNSSATQARAQVYMADEQKASAQLRKHDRLWFEDGSVILTSDVAAIDSLSFRLHRSVLSLHSDIFPMILALPSEVESNEIVEDCPVVHLQDSGDDLERFFGLLYDGGKE